jgi:hypothetical protein
MKFNDKFKEKYTYFLEIKHRIEQDSSVHIIEQNWRFVVELILKSKTLPSYNDIVLKMRNSNEDNINLQKQIKKYCSDSLKRSFSPPESILNTKIRIHNEYYNKIMAEMYG